MYSSTPQTQRPRLLYGLPIFQKLATVTRYLSLSYSNKVAHNFKGFGLAFNILKGAGVVRNVENVSEIPVASRCK